MGDQIPFLFSTELSQMLELRNCPRCSPDSLLAFRECSWLCSTIIISSAADIPNPNLPDRFLPRNSQSMKTRSPVLSHRLHRAFCIFLLPTAALRGLAGTHSSGRTKVRLNVTSVLRSS